MVRPQALMEAVSANLNWFPQPIGENLTKPQKKFLRDDLVGLLRAGNHLLIYGDTENVGACKAALNRSSSSRSEVYSC